MTLRLGVDTGGTYTDAVLLRGEDEVLASAKALTTRHDLAQGITNAVSEVLANSGADPADIRLAALSTTLATNALIEGQGDRAALVFIGFKDGDLARQGLSEALRGDPVLVLQGGHDHAGAERVPLDEGALHDFLARHGAQVGGFAVASQFAVRNPAHENRVADIIREVTGKPVSASHELSARLNGPKRALTALLNARLIGMIDRLISRAEDGLKSLGIPARLMVVRGDGALIAADTARRHPIETILSGPAASIVGACWMTNQQDALVSDIGGTTTDIAVLRGSRPAIDSAGARVGDFQTMVEAVAIRTIGLGGDSEVHVQSEGLEGGLTLGPRRVIPLALAATDGGEAVRAALEAQLRKRAPGENDGRFVRAIAHANVTGLGDRDIALFQRLDERFQPLDSVLKSRLEFASVRRLVGRGAVQVAGLTPSDAAHHLGLVQHWDRDAAAMGLDLVLRRRTGSGDMLAPNSTALARMIVHQLQTQTATALLETVFAEDGAFSGAPDALARHELTRLALGSHSGLLRLSAAVTFPVVGLGASATSYYPALSDLLGCEVVLPDHAGVANAIGAVVGQIAIRKRGTVTSPAEGRFRIHGGSGPADYGEPDAAMSALEAILQSEARAAAEASGAAEIEITVERDLRTARIEERDVFIEATITVEASGRPRIAS